MLHYNNVDLWGGKSWYLPEVESSVYGMARFNNIRYLDPPRIYEQEDPPQNPVELPVGGDESLFFTTGRSCWEHWAFTANVS